MTFGHTVCDRVSALLAMTFRPYLRNIDFALVVMTFDCLRSSAFAPLFQTFGRFWHLSYVWRLRPYLPTLATQLHKRQYSSYYV